MIWYIMYNTMYIKFIIKLQLRNISLDMCPIKDQRKLLINSSEGGEYPVFGVQYHSPKVASPSAGMVLVVYNTQHGLLFQG